MYEDKRNRMKLNLGIIFGLVMLVFTGCNGKTSKNNTALPITMDNMQTYNQKRINASQNIPLGASAIDKAIQIYKLPLEEMGYSFDATIINTTKVLRKAQYNQLSVHTHSVINDIMQYVNMYPEQSIDRNFVDTDTKNKILLFLKYSEFNQNTIQALNYVRQCQKLNNGICSSKQYSRILLDNKFIDSKVDTKKLEQMLGKNMSQHIASQNTTLTDTRLTGLFHSKVGNASEFGKYIEDRDGQQINVGFLFSEYTKPFKLKDNAQKAIDEYNPWWLK